MKTTEGLRDVLLEIGVEELPARVVSPALASLELSARRRFQEAGLSHGDVALFATPRRLAVRIASVAEKSPDQVRQEWGPTMAQARTAEGTWTPAALGFARARGVSPDDLKVQESDRGPRLCLTRTTPGTAAARVLPDLLKGIITDLPFPKTMVWEESRFAFSRPLRWIVALYGDRVVRFSLAGVTSSSKTEGLRFPAGPRFSIPSPARYETVLKDRCVIVDPAQRRTLLLQQARHVLQSGGGVMNEPADESLREEVLNLVEHPTAVLGSFAERFLSLPPEILITSMKRHQKFFPVYADATLKSLAPRFVGIRNGFSDLQPVVREGYERVLAARLEDAAFFFAQDRKKTLASRYEALQGISFLSPALSLRDKMDRVASLVETLAPRLGFSPESVQIARRIAILAKADLTTGMVGEFPELQGIMGRIYAGLDGESEAVARGIEDHYRPLTADGELPVTPESALVSVVDKLDTLAGHFLLDNVPSGSQDPYGLRRAAVGVLRILEERKWSLPLGGIFEQALALLPNTLGDKSRAGGALAIFFRQRWQALAESRGGRPDEVDAVAESGIGDVPESWKRLSAVRALRAHADFERLLAGFRRAANILRQAERSGDWPLRGSVEALDGREETEGESRLKAHLDELTAPWESLRQAGDFAGRLERLAELGGAVDGFFADAVIMDPRPEVRGRRLSLLARVRRLFDEVADFTRLSA